jgi:hypothetical protein
MSKYETIRLYSKSIGRQLILSSLVAVDVGYGFVYESVHIEPPAVP